jgi:hypothetical protein
MSGKKSLSDHPFFLNRHAPTREHRRCALACGRVPPLCLPSQVELLPKCLYFLLYVPSFILFLKLVFLDLGVLNREELNMFPLLQFKSAPLDI